MDIGLGLLYAGVGSSGLWWLCLDGLAGSGWKLDLSVRAGRLSGVVPPQRYCLEP